MLYQDLVLVAPTLTTNRIEQRVVGLTVHNDTLIVIVAQCLVCVCVCQMDSVLVYSPW